MRSKENRNSRVSFHAWITKLTAAAVICYHSSSDSKNDRVGSTIQGDIVTGVEDLGCVELVRKQVFFRNPQEVDRTGMVRSPADQILHDPVAFSHKVDSSITLESKRES